MLPNSDNFTERRAQLKWLSLIPLTQRNENLPVAQSHILHKNSTQTSGWMQYHQLHWYPTLPWGSAGLSKVVCICVCHVLAGREWLELESAEAWLTHLAGAQTGGLQQLAAGTAGDPGISLFPHSLCSREAPQKLEGERGRDCSTFRKWAQKSHSISSTILPRLRQSQKLA